ncbi:MAG: helix-turn-helix domain-containing protein [Firmicutes bacterium]|nr:helix-turn-helix domain-containing protein [Bacillota bacterium]
MGCDCLQEEWKLIKAAPDEIKMLRSSSLRSLNEIVYDDGEGGGLSLADILPAEEWEETTLDRLDVERRIGRLSGRDAKIVRLRMAGFSQAEIAKRVGVSQASVSRILSRLKVVA